jgi:hypothetical protein
MKTSEFLNYFGQNYLENFRFIDESVSLLISNGFTEEESKAIVSDYLKEFSVHELNELNHNFEGIYSNFREFAKEFHEDSDAEGDFELFQNELKDDFVFCNNSKAVFRKP